MDRLEEQGARPATLHTLSEGVSSGHPTQLELLFQKAPIGLCIIDRDLRYISINETLASINGKPVEYQVVHTIGEVIPEIAEAFELVLRKVIKTGQSALNIEFRCPAPANPQEERFWLVNIYPLLDYQQTVEAAGVIVQDITNLKRAETDLLESRHLLHTLIESTKAVPWVADAKTGQFTYVGPRVVDLLGYPIESWFEENFWLDHIHPDDRESVVDLRIKSYCLGLKDYEYEYRMIASMGVSLGSVTLSTLSGTVVRPRLLEAL